MITPPPPSLNAKQSLFIREYSSGLHKTQKDAAIAAGYSKFRAKVTASQILSRQDARSYYNSIQSDSTAVAVEELGFSKIDACRVLVDMITAQPGSASSTNPLCDTIMTRDGVEYILPPKLPALALLGKLMGYGEAKGVNVTGVINPGLRAILDLRDV
jgi:hypothetical protein